MSDDFVPELKQIIEQAQKLGYVSGRNDMRQSLTRVITDYADLSTTQLMTASDAFRLILTALVEDEEDKPIKEYE